MNVALTTIQFLAKRVVKRETAGIVGLARQGQPGRPGSGLMVSDTHLMEARCGPSCRWLIMNAYPP